MTTEIAVINRLGIALATDSAVTISGDGHTKVFDSADKLFELSCEFPVAVMVNGNMDCFGLPWEIAIKDFRSEHGATARSSIADWTLDFLGFVEQHKYVGEEQSKSYIFQLARSEIDYLKNRIFEIAWRTNKRNPKTVPQVAHEHTLSISNERLRFLEGVDIADSLTGFSVDSIIEAHGDDINSFVIKEFAPVEISDEAIGSIVKQICRAALVIIHNEHSTGLIVAGYGVNDAFPTLTSYDVEGFVLGKLKYSSKDVISVKYEALGHVVSFAQTDVIERLLMGVDPRFVAKSAEFIKMAIEELGSQISEIGAKRRISKAEQCARKEAISLLSDISQQKYLETADSLRSEFKVEFERMVAMMPKLELIELAEALVSITVIERKATPDEGTVGGPIDVAFVTKHEGFVWIKRKHYFDPALNPRYFWRKYNIGKRE